VGLKIVPIHLRATTGHFVAVTRLRFRKTQGGRLNTITSCDLPSLKSIEFSPRPGNCLNRQIVTLEPRLNLALIAFCGILLAINSVEGATLDHVIETQERRTHDTRPDKGRLAYRPLSSHSLLPITWPDLAMVHLRIPSSSGKNIEEHQAPALAAIGRVPGDAVAEPSNGTLTLIGAFSIMASGNKDIIMPGMTISLLNSSRSIDYLTFQALLRLCTSSRPRVAPPQPRHEQPPLPLVAITFIDGVPHLPRRCPWLLPVARALILWIPFRPRCQGHRSPRHSIPHTRC
jgi:hypothetical protein